MERDDLQSASKRGDLEAVKGLLAQTDVDINSRDGSSKTPLHAAAEEGRLNVVKFLVENGADKGAKNNEDRTPLHFAAENGH
jgi:ankyrin repeat protein